MPDWETDGPHLQGNLSKALDRARDAMRARAPLNVALMRGYHLDIMDGLTADDPNWIGAYRGEPGVENIQVYIGVHTGVPPEKVTDELADFDQRLGQAITSLDAALPAGQLPNEDQLAAILSLSAWAHGEWVRIHPFANGNGRSARLWVNMIAMRYGLPPYLVLRPRPDGAYGACASSAMIGNWQAFAPVLKAALNDFLQGDPD